VVATARLARHGGQYQTGAKQGATAFTLPGLSARHISTPPPEFFLGVDQVGAPTASPCGPSGLRARASARERAGPGRWTRRPRRSPRDDVMRNHICERNLIERFFNKIKHFRAIATRYDKPARNFLAAIQLVSAIVLLN
jgi:hypothetical protein